MGPIVLRAVTPRVHSLNKKAKRFQFARKITSYRTRTGRPTFLASRLIKVEWQKSISWKCAKLSEHRESRSLNHFSPTFSRPLLALTPKMRIEQSQRVMMIRSFPKGPCLGSNDQNKNKSFFPSLLFRIQGLMTTTTTTTRGTFVSPPPSPPHCKVCLNLVWITLSKLLVNDNTFFSLCLGLTLITVIMSSVSTTVTSHGNPDLLLLPLNAQIRESSRRVLRVPLLWAALCFIQLLPCQTLLISLGMSSSLSQSQWVDPGQNQPWLVASASLGFKGRMAENNTKWEEEEEENAWQHCMALKSSTDL